MKQVKYILLVSLLLLTTLTGCQKEHLEGQKAVNGVLDLSEWNFAKAGRVPLDGQWEFYWNQMIVLEDEFEENSLTGFYPMPSYWTKYKDLKLPMTGYATYRLRIKLPQADQVLSLSFPEIYSEYAISVNGKLFSNNLATEQKSSGYLCPKVYDVYVPDRELELVVQIKNTEHIYQGINTSIQLGEPSEIHQVQNINFSLDFLVAAICLLSSIYHFALFLRHRNKEIIYFSFICLFIFIRTILSNESILVKLYPDFPFYLGLKITTLTIPFCLIAMTLYTKVLYSEDVPKIAVRVIIVTNVCYSLLVLCSPWEVYFNLFLPYLVTVFLSCLCGFYVIYRIIKMHRPESLFYASGNLFLAIGTITDIIIYLCAVSSIHYVSYGMVIFVLIQGMLVGRRYLQATKRIEVLASDLQTSLYKIDATETAFLNAQIKPHFLYNALNTIANYCHTEPKEAEQLILYLAKYLRGTLNFENLGNVIPLHKELELVSAYCYIQRARYNNMIFNTEIDKALIHYSVPPLILQPLVENAIKHGIRNKKSQGEIILRIHREDRVIRFSVEDNGAGIAQEKRKALLAHPKDMKSIGLYNIHQRLLRLYGKGLVIESIEGNGTTVKFEIPIREEAYV